MERRRIANKTTNTKDTLKAFQRFYPMEVVRGGRGQWDVRVESIDHRFGKGKGEADEDRAPFME